MTISGKQLRDAVISGANNIVNNKNMVDELNVFPVPDGDTGTNMSMTIGNALAELKQMNDGVTVGAVADAAASAMLRGARGNSGVILSLLFRGFSKGLKGKTTATVKDFASSLALGVEAAYKSVMKPTEGTILTVARVASEYAKEALAQGKEVLEVFESAIEGATYNEQQEAFFEFDSEENNGKHAVLGRWKVMTLEDYNWCSFVLQNGGDRGHDLFMVNRRYTFSSGAMRPESDELENLAIACIK